MRFGLFGGARTEIGDQVSDSHNLYRVRRLHLRGRGARLSQRLPGRAPFHRLRPGLGDAEFPDLSRRQDDDAAARHRGAGVALAQPGAARRAGRDPGPPVERPVRFRHRQGLSLGRVPRLLHPDGGGRGALSGDGRVSAQGMDDAGPVFASRQILAFRGCRHRAGAGAEAASAIVDRRASPTSIRFAAEKASTCCWARAAARRPSPRGSRSTGGQSRRRAGCSIRRWSGCTRALHIAMNDDEREKARELRAKFMAQRRAIVAVADRRIADPGPPAQDAVATPRRTS